MLSTRIIANLCGQVTPDVVVQLKAQQVTTIAQALTEMAAEDDGGLATAFHSIQRMLAAGETDVDP